MRQAFAEEILAAADADQTIALLSGDIGNRMFDTFKQRHAERFFNCGVAEANMTGLAAGLAMSGLRPVTYTIAAFATVRCLEQIRVDLCYHDLPVTIVGVGGGLGYANLGYTHHATEDIALLRALPNMVVLCPGDPSEVKGAMRAALRHDGPVYIRLGKKGERQVHPGVPEFQIGKALELGTGDDVCLLAVGTTLAACQDAAAALSERNIGVRLFSFPSVKPLDEELLDEVFGRYRLVVLAEEHSLIGGAGSAVAEWLVDGPARSARLLRIGLADAVFGAAGSPEYARECLGLTGQAIAQRVDAAWREVSR
jgi:transketolase